MFDNTQTVHTKDLAAAVRALSGLFLNEKQLTKKQITDDKGEVHIICPGMITRIRPVKLYEPLRNGSEVFYVNGERFTIDLTTEVLSDLLEFSADKK